MNVTIHKSCWNHLQIGCRVSLAGLALAFAAGAATAADHRVTPSTSKFNCSSVSPGDTVTLSSGSRGPLVIENCTGTSSRPIVVRNDPLGKGPTVVERTSGGAGGFVFTCSNCVGTRIDGSGKWVGAPSTTTYGIKLTMSGGESPTAFMKIRGLSRFVTIRGVEIDGRWPALATDGIGISVNDHAVFAADHPGVWTESLLIEDNYVHHVEGEGLYIGPNWPQGGLPLRNIEIRRNLVEDTGWNGINLKSSIGGGNEIHHNVVRRPGKSNDAEAGQHSGIALLEGGAKIYNNWVEDAGESGITHYLLNLPSSYGAQVVEIFNNVVISAGRTGPLDGHGISSAGKAGSALPQPKIYSNTIVGTEGYGIKVGPTAKSGLVTDNIVADAGDAPVSAPDGVSVANNLIGTTAKMGFADASRKDFRLQSSSPARNAGSSQFPAVDFDNVPRPQDGVADQGAFEFTGNAVKPEPPQALTIE